MAWEADAPDPPNYAEATREGIITDIETLPLRRSIEAAAKQGLKVDYTDPRTGEKKSVDFTGMGDIDQSMKMLDFGIESADKLAKSQLEISQKYGADFIAERKKELELADPTGAAIREKMGKSVLGDLEAGQQLSDGIKADVVESERAAQAARGNVVGASSGAAEAMTVGNAGYRLWQQKLANAASFLSGATPQAQFASLTGAQQGVTPFQMAGVQAGTNINANAAAQGWQAAQNKWQMEFAKEQWEFQNSPWTKLFDTFNSMLVSAAGSMSGMAMG